MIGSLLYLTTVDLTLYLVLISVLIFQAFSKESHLFAVKRIIKYVNGTLGYGIWFILDTNADIAGYTDADWAGSADDRKSTSGGCFYVGNNLVAWHSKK